MQLLVNNKKGSALILLGPFLLPGILLDKNTLFMEIDSVFQFFLTMSSLTILTRSK